MRQRDLARRWPARSSSDECGGRGRVMRCPEWACPNELPTQRLPGRVNPDNTEFIAVAARPGSVSRPRALKSSAVRGGESGGRGVMG